MRRFNDQMGDLHGETVLLTGGTGSFGKQIIQQALQSFETRPDKYLWCGDCCEGDHVCALHGRLRACKRIYTGWHLTKIPGSKQARLQGVHDAMICLIKISLGNGVNNRLVAP